MKTKRTVNPMVCKRFLPAVVLSACMAALAPAATIQRIAGMGDVVTERGTTFVDLTEEVGPRPSIDQGQVAFTGLMDNGSRGLFLADGPGSYTLLADDAVAAPGGGTFGSFGSVQIRQGQVAFRSYAAQGRTVFLYNGVDHELVASPATPIALPGGGSTSVQYPGAVGLGPAGVVFNGNPTVSSGRGLYYWDGSTVRQIVAPADDADHPFLTSQGAFCKSGEPQDSIRRVDVASGVSTTLLDTSTVIPGSTSTFDQYGNLSARQTGLAFFGFSGTGGPSGFYALPAGASTPVVIANSDTPRPTGGDFGDFGDIAFGKSVGGRTDVLFTEDNVLYHAVHDGSTTTFAPLVAEGDELDGREVSYISISSDAYDGRYGVFLASFDDYSHALYRVDVGDGGPPPLPPRGFRAESHIEHSDGMVIWKQFPIPAVENVSNVDEVVEGASGVTLTRSLSPTYNLQPPGSAPDASFPQNFGRTRAEATEQEIAFMPGVYGPIVRAASTAEWQVGYAGDVNGRPDTRRTESFTNVEAVAKAVSYYRAVGGAPGDPVTVGIAFTFEGFLQTTSGTFLVPDADAPPDTPFPWTGTSYVELVVKMTANGRTVVIFDGEAELGASDAENLRDEDTDFENTFLLEELTGGPDLRLWSVNVSRSIDDAFDDPTLVRVGDLVAFSVELRTNVEGVGGLTQFSAPDVTMNGAEANGAFSDFYDTFQGGLISTTDGVSMVITVPEPATIALLVLGSLTVLRRKK